MSYKSDISVIIVNYNTSGHLSECLESFRKYFPENEIEIIVSDNNSTDGKLPELVNKFPEVKFFRET
ncbi:MAG: glycosyltransferase [Ignavibacteria bacterium]|nr:glycosyltransferase [Ignavibacteria bacterium]